MTRRRTILNALLLFAGLQIALLLDEMLLRSRGMLAAMVLAIVTAFMPQVRSTLAAVGRQIDGLRGRRRGVLTLGIVLLAGGYFSLSAAWNDRVIEPLLHDEFSYLLQARMLAGGRLWMPPLPPAFETFYVFVTPVYSSQYFPGNALWLAIGMVLRLPIWVMPLLTASLCVGGVFRIVARSVSNSAGLLAALVAGCSPLMRYMSFAWLAQPLTLLLMLGLIASVIAWKRRDRTLVAYGALLGWICITRPVDALGVMVPTLAYIALRLVSQRASAGRWLRVSVLIALPAMPFVSLMAVHNYGVTGSIFRSPFSLYAQRDLPGVSMGFSHETSDTIASVVPAKQRFYQQTIRPWLERHTPAMVVHEWLGGLRLRVAVPYSLSDPLLIAVMFMGLFSLRTPVHWTIAATGLALAIGYSFYPLIYLHYGMCGLPVLCLLYGLGAQRLIENLGRVGWAMVLVSVVACLGGLPEIGQRRAEEFFPPTIRQMLDQVDKTPGRLLVIVRDTQTPANDIEFVYNWETAWPDDARVIYVQDLGESSTREIVADYARRQPDRRAMRYDRDSHSLTPLGP